MHEDEAMQFLIYTYKLSFDRTPRDKEIEVFLPKLLNDEFSPSQFLFACMNSQEYRTLHAMFSMFPMGHYHSPVVDPKTVHEYVDKQRDILPSELSGISINIDAMRALWLKHLEFTKNNPFTETPNERDRFRFGDSPFPEGDAITLQIIFAEHRPKRVIEIGSGFSTACMLDSADRLALSDLNLVCIEPHPERLYSLLKSTDNITVIDKPVQNVDSAMTDTLQSGDILFIDSTHVLKTGSDVHYEFFSLLPRLRPGVIIHFHDVFYPFEYPDRWIFESNYSWNEAYALRAFLMYNKEFEILYWHSLLRSQFSTLMSHELPRKSGNYGGSIWLRRKDPCSTFDI